MYSNYLITQHERREQLVHVRRAAVRVEQVLAVAVAVLLAAAALRLGVLVPTLLVSVPAPMRRVLVAVAAGGRRRKGERGRTQG